MPPGEVGLSGKAVPLWGPLPTGRMPQQGELGTSRGILLPELESPVKGMSWPTTAPQPVEETQLEGGRYTAGAAAPNRGRKTAKTTITATFETD